MPQELKRAVPWLDPEESFLEMEKNKIKYEQRQLPAACSDYLRQLADGLHSGAVNVRHGREALTLHPGTTVDFKIAVSQKDNKESIKLELEWPRRAKLTDMIGKISKRSEPTPAALLARSFAPPKRRIGAYAAPYTPEQHAVSEQDQDSARDQAVAPEKAAQPERAEDRAVRSLSDVDEKTELAARVVSRERLYEMAKAFEIEGRSQLDKHALAAELIKAGVDPLEELNHKELYAAAQDAGVQGRSSMSKDELIQALTEQNDDAEEVIRRDAESS